MISPNSLSLPSFIDCCPAVSTSALFGEISQLYIASNSNIDLATKSNGWSRAVHRWGKVDKANLASTFHGFGRWWKYMTSNLSFLRAHAHYEDGSVKRLAAQASESHRLSSRIRSAMDMVSSLVVSNDPWHSVAFRGIPWLVLHNDINSHGQLEWPKFSRVWDECQQVV